MFSEDILPIAQRVAESVEDDTFALCCVKTADGLAWVYFPLPQELPFDKLTVDWVCDEVKAGLDGKIPK